jgi:hypothetical protein
MGHAVYSVTCPCTSPPAWRQVVAMVLEWMVKQQFNFFAHPECEMSSTAARVTLSNWTLAREDKSKMGQELQGKLRSWFFFTTKTFETAIKIRFTVHSCCCPD